MKKCFSVSTRCALILMCLGAFVRPTHSQILVERWVDIPLYYLDSKAEHRVTRRLYWSEWVETGRKIYDFTLKGGTLTYHFGVSKGSTNIIYQEQYVRDLDNYTVDVTRCEFYHNRYSTGGMQTNILSRTFGGPNYTPTDDWLIGTRVRTVDNITRLTDKGMFTLRYINTNNYAAWGSHHMLIGSKNTSFTNTFIVDGLSIREYAPSLGDFTPLTKKNLTWAIEQGEEWFTPPPPEDELWSPTPQPARTWRRR
ncbi:MAG: hypothetical protein AAB381_02905 [Patescibacteria group bacterium]